MPSAATPSDIRIFATIAEQGSFVRAANLLQIPTTTVSRKIEELEARLGVRLLQRSTRKLALTEAGDVFYAHCGAILAGIEDAESAIGHLTAEARGILRVIAPYSFAVNALAPALPAFWMRHPEVRIELTVRNDQVNLIAENFDVGVCVSNLPDSGLVSRPLGTRRGVLVASPAYLKAVGTPGSLAELSGHRTLTHAQHGRRPGGNQGWLLQQMDGVVPGRLTPPSQSRLRPSRSTAPATSIAPSQFVAVRPVLSANAAETLLQAAIAGLGIACLPLTLVTTALNAGTLIQLLPDWSTAPLPLQVVYPSRRGLQPKVRVFVEFLLEHFEETAHKKSITAPTKLPRQTAKNRSGGGS